MTTHVPLTAPVGHYRVKHVARSEILKIFTLRSTAITLGLTFAACLLVTGLVTRNALHQPAGWYQGFDPTMESLSGMFAAVLTGGVLGALLIAGEYSSGTIRGTLAAAPKRPVLLATKLGVTATLTLVFFEFLSFSSFFLGQAILSVGGAPSATLASPGAARAVIMTGVFIALVALMSFGFGLIFRNTAAAIAAFVGVIFVLPLVMHGISQADVKFLPTNILSNSIMTTVNNGPAGPGPFGPVTPVVGLLLMAIYTAIVLAMGATSFGRRDA